MISLIRHCFAAALGVTALTTSSVASAALIDAINSLDRGDLYRVVFVTSTTRNATSTNIADYNQFVADAASSGSITASLGFSWTALASTAGVNAQTNTGISASDTSPVTFFNTGGEVIAESGFDLFDGSLLSPIGATENGLVRDALVWTGSTVSGSGANAAQLGTSSPRLGASSRVDANWMSLLSLSGSFAFSLYGVSEVAQVAVLPASPMLLLPGLVLIVGRSLRGRKRAGA